MSKRHRLLWLALFLGVGPLLVLSWGMRARGVVRAATAQVDGVGEAAYGPPIATDAAGDLASPGPADWGGTHWTDVISLYVTNDGRNLYVFVPLPAYDHTLSSGSYGLLIATGRYTAPLTATPPTDPWGNAITFAYTGTLAAGQTVPLPYYLIADVVLRGNVVGSGSDDNGWLELRRWNGSDYTTGAGTDWGGIGNTGRLVGDRVAFADGEGVEFAIPFDELGISYTVGLPLYLQFFGTQTAGTKGAYDTVPADDQSNGWDDPTVQRLLATYTLTRAQEVHLVTPTEGEHCLTPQITVTGYLSPVEGVTLTLALNGTTTFTPSVDGVGRFTQPVVLTQGLNIITATATGPLGVAFDVRHVTYGPASQDNDVWWACLGHFTRDEVYRSPWGARPAGTTVTLRLRACANDLTGVTLHAWPANLTAFTATMTPSTHLTDPAGVYVYWETVITLPLTPTILFYKFEVADGSDVDWYIDDTDFDGRNGWGRGYDDDGGGGYAFDLTVYAPDFTTPAWMRDAVLYQIFPDRFRNGDPTNDIISGTHAFYTNTHGGITYTTWNAQVIDPRDPQSPFYERFSEDFYGGDLHGIIEKLDDLESLGVTALYLNPIFLSPSNHRYDTTDFTQIDPRLGDGLLLTRLITEAARRGMAVILDGVFNHTSSDSIYFDKYSRYETVGAYEATTSTYYTWYTFNNWPDDYVSWWGYDTLPKLRSDDAGVRAYFWGDGVTSIGGRWVLSGTRGWRLDVGGDVDGGAWLDPANDYWEGFRQTVKAANAEAVIFGEEWGDARSWLLGGEWDSVMNYRFRSALLSFLRDRTYWDNDNNDASSGGTLHPITVSAFDRWLRQIQEDYPPPAWYAMVNLVDSHDTNRVRFVLSKWQKGYDDTDPAAYDPATDLSPEETDARQKLLALLQFTLPGVPMVYYGDEVGVDAPGAWHNGKWEDDPYNRVPFPWDDTPGYYQARSGIRAHYARLAHLRRDHPALRRGSFDTLLTDDSRALYAYGRKAGGDRVVVAVNRDTVPHTVTLDVADYLTAGLVVRDLLHGGGPYTVTAEGRLVVPLAAMDGRVLGPAPALTLRKTAWPTGTLSRGGLITYTVTLTNGGDGPAGDARLTDTLPAQVSFARWLVRPAGAAREGQTLTWRGTVTAGEAVVLRFVVTHTGGYSETLTNEATYAYLTDGGTARVTQTVEAPPASCPAPLSGVTLSGPTAGYTGTAYTFTAAVAPAEATQPITYVWRTGERVITHTGGASDTAVLSWTVAGVQVITVTATNCGGTVTATHAITLSEEAAVQFAITKSVTPTGQVAYGDLLTYTLLISTSADAVVGLYDPLEGSTFRAFAPPVAGVQAAGGAITGRVVLTAHQPVTVRFVVQVGVPATAGWEVDLRNRACLYPWGGSLADCRWSNAVVNRALRRHPLYLPLITRGR